MSSKRTRPDEWSSKPSNIRRKGLEIAWGERPIVRDETKRKKRRSDEDALNIWYVPSQSSSNSYEVNLRKKTCQCAFWKDQHVWCKHLEAARIQKAKEEYDESPDDEIELLPVANPYRQAPWYDALAEEEETLVRQLARSLGRRFPHEQTGKRGRPRLPLGDIIACGINAAYLNRPSRKSKPLHAEELIQGARPPSPQTVRKAMQSTEVTAALRESIKQVALCTSKIDTSFSIDATLMKTPLSQIHYVRMAQLQRPVLKILNCKVTYAIGVDTFIAYGIDVADGRTSDQVLFTKTMDQFQDFVRFDMVLADAGYDSEEHFKYVGEKGGKPIIAIRDLLKRQPQLNKPHFNMALKMWKAKDPAWIKGYGKRALSESGNSCLKRTVKRVIRARNEPSRENEVLFAMLAYNLMWLIRARAKHRIDIPWAAQATLDQIDQIVEDNRLKRERKDRKAALRPCIISHISWYRRANQDCFIAER
jgi:transposase